MCLLSQKTDRQTDRVLTEASTYTVRVTLHKPLNYVRLSSFLEIITPSTGFPCAFCTWSMSSKFQFPLYLPVVETSENLKHTADTVHVPEAGCGRNNAITTALSAFHSSRAVHFT